MRTRIQTALKEAMHDGDSLRVSTLRLMLAALKDREIALRAEDGPDALDDGQVMALLARMVKQREESAATYEEAARMELAESERREAQIILEFLPKPLSEAETADAIRSAIDTTGAASIRDMGKVMAWLKLHYAGRMDFTAAGARVKSALG